MNINRSDGWVKLHKKILFSNLIQDQVSLHLFITLLLMAHHEESFASIRFKGKQRYLKPGELSISKVELADYLECPTTRVKNALNRLKLDNRIEVETDNHKTIIRICNWDKYQSKDVQPKNRPVDQQAVQPEVDRQSNPHLVKRIKNKELRIKNNTKVLQNANYGNENINRILEYFQQRLNLPTLDGTTKENRYAAQRLLVKAKSDVSAVEKLIDVLAADDFHSINATSVRYLEKHYVAILNRARGAQKGIRDADVHS